MTLRKPLLLLSLSGTLALAACGGDSGSNDEDTIRGIVEDSAKNPVKVCDNLAPAPLKTIGGKAACQKLAKAQKGRDAKIDSVSITGDKAAVKADDGTGSSTLNLQKIDGAWKLVLG